MESITLLWHKSIQNPGQLAMSGLEPVELVQVLVSVLVVHEGFLCESHRFAEVTQLGSSYLFDSVWYMVCTKFIDFTIL